jgi:hypothetical protein
MQFRSLFVFAIFSLGAVAKPKPAPVPVPNPGFNHDCSNVCYNSDSSCKFIRRRRSSKPPDSNGIVTVVDANVDDAMQDICDLCFNSPRGDCAPFYALWNNNYAEYCD